MHSDRALLQLLQLADSALPIGATSHSFGLETLVAEGNLDVAQLETFLHDHIQEAGALESAFCRCGYRLAAASENEFETHWLALNARLSALKTARESRTASATLGRRLLQLVYGLEEHPRLQRALQLAKEHRSDIHHSIAFGLVSGILEIDETTAILAYLQQSLMSQVSAFQRLLPLGQSQASRLIWQLKPALTALVRQNETTLASVATNEDIAVFTPLIDVGSMRHPNLPTRLFIS
jgi:urease accessory protein